MGASINVCMYVCMHACMHACMYVCMYVIEMLNQLWIRLGILLLFSFVPHNMYGTPQIK